MIRKLFFTIMLLQNVFVETNNTAAQPQRDGPDSIADLSPPFPSGKKKKYDDKEGCFCDGGCYSELPFQTRCCVDICEDVEAKGTSYDCAEHCPCYRSTVKHETQLAKCINERELCQRHIESLSPSSDMTERRLRELTRQLENARAKLDIITKVWLPTGLLVSMFLTSLGFSCLTKWKMGKLVNGTKGENCSLGASSNASSTNFQKNILNQLNNFGSPRNVNIHNQNNSRGPGGPAESPSSGSTISATNSTNLILNMPNVAMRPGGLSNSLPTSRSGSCHRGSNINPPIQGHHQLPRDLQRRHHLQLSNSNHHPPYLNQQLLPAVARRQSSTTRMDAPPRHQPREGRGRERTPAETHHRRHVLMSDSERRSCSMGKIMRKPPRPFHERRDESSASRQQCQVATVDPLAVEVAARDGGELLHELEEFIVQNLAKDEEVAKPDDDAEDDDVTRLKQVA